MESKEVDRINSEKEESETSKPKRRRRRKSVDKATENSETKDGVTKIKDEDQGFEMPSDNPDDINDVIEDSAKDNQTLAEEEQIGEEPPVENSESNEQVPVEPQVPVEASDAENNE